MQDFFSSPQRPDLPWGPPSLLSKGYRKLFTGGKGQGREANHSPPSNAESICFHGIVLNEVSKGTALPSPYLTRNTLRLRYENRPVNAPQGNNRCLLEGTHQTHVGKMQSIRIMKQVVYILTIVF
jgi:hypothetical protein